MTNIQQYVNIVNGGMERVTFKNGKFYIASDWGSGFSEDVEVSRQQVKRCMEFTNAPISVRESILAC